MTTHELKPCPFCGHETNAVSDNGAGLVFTVICGNGSCRARGPWERCAADAPNGWNTRTNDQAISTLTAEIEELREALEPFADLAEWIAKEMPHKDHDAEEVQIASWPYSLSVGWLRRAHDLVNKGKAQ